jgi:hypothetical protein
MKKLIILSGAVLLTTSSLTFAAGGQKGSRDFVSFDTNSDGVISQQEAQGRIQSDFSNIDADGSNGITAQEFNTMRAERMAERVANRPTFETIDTNKDGMMSKQEFETFQAERMAKNMSMNQQGGKGNKVGYGNKNGKGKNCGNGNKNGNGNGNNKYSMR